MYDLRNRLIKLGSEKPELQENLRPILDHLSKTSYDESSFDVKVVSREYDMSGDIIPGSQDVTEYQIESLEKALKEMSGGRAQIEVLQNTDDFAKLERTDEHPSATLVSIWTFSRSDGMPLGRGVRRKIYEFAKTGRL